MKEINLFIGIDIGQNGAIASYLRSTDTLSVINIPLLIEDLRDYLNDLRSKHSDLLVCIEQVSLWGNDFSNIGKTFRTNKMVKMYDDATAVLRLYGFPHVRTTPLEWETYLNLKIKEDEKYYYRKKRLYEAAVEYFPNTYISREQADAVLVCRFLMKKYQFDREWIEKKIPQSVLDKM